MFDRKDSDSSEFWLGVLETVPILGFFDQIVTSQRRLSFKYGIDTISCAKVSLQYMQTPSLFYCWDYLSEQTITI